MDPSTARSQRPNNGHHPGEVGSWLGLVVQTCMDKGGVYEATERIGWWREMVNTNSSYFYATPSWARCSGVKLDVLLGRSQSANQWHLLTQKFRVLSMLCPRLLGFDSEKSSFGSIHGRPIFIQYGCWGELCLPYETLPDPRPVLDKNRAPVGQKFYPVLGLWVWRKAPMAFPDSSSVLDKFQSATSGFTCATPPHARSESPQKAHVLYAEECMCMCSYVHACTLAMQQTVPLAAEPSTWWIITTSQSPIVFNPHLRSSPPHPPKRLHK